MKIIRALGLVFGDIGTSPIYTVSVIFLLVNPTPNNIMGIISLIIWTLLILVTVEYSWLAMSLGKGNEGGTIVLKELLVPLLKKARPISFFTILTYLGISLLIGDGVITPAISILSAVEGINLIPGLELPQMELVIIAIGIAVGLFVFQKKGSDKVAGIFGPIMVLWFIVLAVTGIASISVFPVILKAINPWYAISFLVHNGWIGFFTLSEVILCATGAEALYADMGHIGRRPIINAWLYVFVALILNYMGQGAYLLANPGAKNVLFEMVSAHFSSVYILFLLLTITATVIASQALISGMFSIIYQAITTHILPMLKVEYTSSKLRSQIYINSVNWTLLFCVIYMMLFFQESHKLAAAYGFAVTGTMVITGIMMTSIFYINKKYFKGLVAIGVTLVDIIFFCSNLYKLPAGGYWSVIIAAAPFLGILIFTSVQKKIFQTIAFIEQDKFLNQYLLAYRHQNKIKGTALFLMGNINLIPPYVANTMFTNGILYEQNIFFSIKTTNEPYGINGDFKEDIAEGLRYFVLNVGYMEYVDVEAILHKRGVDEKVIFYGMEDIVTEKFSYKMYAAFKKLAPSFVQFYKLPSTKIHGVVSMVEL